MSLFDHLMTMRTRNQTKFLYIFVLYGHVLVSLRVPLRLCSLSIFRNWLLLIHTSVHFSVFLLFLCSFLYFTNSFVLYPSFFLTLKILLSFIIPFHCIIMTQYVLQYLLSLVYHEKSTTSLWMLIFLMVRLKSQFMICFLQINLC